MLQIDSEGLFERSIKNGVAGGVREIGEDERVFCGESMRRRGVEIKRSGCDENESHYCGCEEWQA